MAEEAKNKQKNYAHEIFLVSIFLKGVDGVLEVTGGLLLFLVSSSQINQLVVLLTQHELSEDAKDVVANYLINTAASLSLGAQLFGAFYLLSHGLVKVVLVGSLWRQKFWAYPTAIIFLFIFIFYQLYRFSYDHSSWLIWLTVFDILIIFLTQNEYKNLKNKL